MRSSAVPMSTAWPPQVAPATLAERRSMKKAAQPEHSYTGYIPKWLQEKDDPDQEAPQRTRHAPILGYSGHLRHEEDRIGMTFSKGFEISRQPEPARAGPLTGDNSIARQPNNQANAESTSKKRVTFQDQPTTTASKPTGARATIDTTPAAMSRSSGYRDFEKDRNGGDFQSRPTASRGGSGYGAFDGASGYGEFAAPPPRQGKPGMSPRSAYGAFDQASGYGEFLAPPGMSPRSGYGAFDGASGYGQFLAPPRGAPGRESMSARSGYGDFDQASGYGQFMAPPGEDMSPRSGYGEFDNASGYGAFMARPEDGGDDEETSPRSQDSQGYGAFGGGGGSEYGDFMSRRSGYGAFDNASGYGEFMAAPPSSSGRGRSTERPVEQPSRQQARGPAPQRQIIVKLNDDLDRKYQRALKAVGGATSVARLLDAFAATITQRHYKRTELLQTIKRNFEKHEHENQGQMTKAHLKEALLGLACVFTDDQIMALMGVYDPECRGTVPVDAILTDLTKRFSV